ncbi:hypothetical protein JHK82_042597 [Glycine max]|uniref:Uncharacterized protein n=1 Tax=Glycine max TaxID=3847 RepID=K7MBY7_SOYBN|nr:hypothetical protein JHK85_043258 [Glycine max]KAG5105627.1 hypothetical protein JHK82_042597 [Glycine max]
MHYDYYGLDLMEWKQEHSCNRRLFWCVAKQIYTTGHTTKLSPGCHSSLGSTSRDFHLPCHPIINMKNFRFSPKKKKTATNFLSLFLNLLRTPFKHGDKSSRFACNWRVSSLINVHPWIKTKRLRFTHQNPLFHSTHQILNFLFSAGKQHRFTIARAITTIAPHHLLCRHRTPLTHTPPDLHVTSLANTFSFSLLVFFFVAVLGGGGLTQEIVSTNEEVTCKNENDTYSNGNLLVGKK